MSGDGLSFDDYLPYEDKEGYREDLDNWWDNKADNGFEDWTSNATPNSQ